MSSTVFPTMAGLGWDVKKTPIWRTKVSSAVSGKEARLSYMTYPLYRFELHYNVLRQAAATDELAQIVGLFNQMRGMWDTFLYTDPTDNTVTNASPAQFGVGDGTTTVFQLTRPYGGFTEPVQNLNGAPTILDNGSAAGAHTVGSTGIVTFTTAPLSGHTLTWHGSFYYRCRFLQDESEFNNFSFELHELQQLQFQSVKL